MNELSVDELLAMQPEAIEAVLPDQHPVAYYLYAQRLLQQGQRDPAVFWAYVGQLRYRFMLHTLAGGEQSAATAYFAALQEGVGLAINRAIGSEPDRWWQILGEVLAWDQASRNGHTCRQQHASAWAQTRAGLELFRETLKRDAEAIASRFRSASTGVHRVDLATIAPQPWRNGGGLTRELLQWPLGSAADAWQLRVSVADIERSGPFSAFPDIERWFAVLEGAGVTLELPDVTRVLGPDDEPVFFPGECQPQCRLVDGRTRDLNLMLRRGAGVVRIHRAGGGTMINGRTRWRAVYALADGRLEVDGVVEPFHAGELLWAQRRGDSCWRLLDDAAAVSMVLEA